ncbi:unnamed protein product, partial [Mesorhabditis spiculigera]
MSYTVRIATLCLLASATVAQLSLGSNEQAATDCLQCPNPIGDIKALACAVDWISKLRILNKTTTTIGGQTVDAYTLEHLDILKGTLEIPSLMIVPNGPCGLVLNVDAEYLISGVLAGKSALFTNLCLQILQTAEPLLDKVNKGLLGEVSDLLCSVFDILPTLDTWLAGNGGLLGHLLGANGNPLLDGLIGGPSGAPGVVDVHKMSYTVRIATLCLLASATVAQLSLGSNEQAATDCLQCPNPIGDIKALACAVDWISKLRILNKTTTTIGGQTVDAYTLEHLDILKGTLEIPSLMIVPNGPCGLVLNVDAEYLISGVLAGKSALFTNLCLQILQTAEPLLDKVNQGLLGEVSDLLCSVFDILPTLDTWLAGNGGLLGHLLGANGNPLLDGLIGGPSGAPGVVDAVCLVDFLAEMEEDFSVD